MNKISNLLIPGWRGKINTDLLKSYIIEFNREDIPISTLEYYIKNGEYQSTFPFGLLARDNKFYIICFKDPVLKEIIVIRNYIGEVIKEVELDNFTKQEGICIFIHTIMDFLYIKYGFEKPVNVRTFLGKYAKGKLSYRKELIKEISINISKKKNKINIYKSVKHEIFIDSNDFIVSFLPNYEIYSTLFDLPISQNQRRLLEINPEWQGLIYLNPEKFINRFEEYSSFIKNNLKNFGFLNDVNINITFPVSLLNYPEEVFIEIFKDNFNLNQSISFEKNLLNHFMANLENIPPIEIEIIVDNFGLSKDSKCSKIVKNYLKKFRNSSLFVIKEIYYVENIEEFIFSNKYPYLILINNKIKGSEFIYAYVKKKGDISKVINFSTLEIINDFTEHLLLIWLAFHYRTNKKLIWHFHNSSKFQRIISFGVYYDSDFNIFKISGIILNNINKELIEIKEIYFRSPRNQERDEIVGNILNLLENKYHFHFEKDLFIFDLGNYSKDFIEKIKNKSTCVLIEIPNSRIFSISKNLYKIPKNGSYIQLFNRQNIYLLINTGYPDTPKQGLPNPLKIEIFSSLDEYKPIKILQDLFNLSFYQTESFSKVNVPFLVKYKNKEIYNKIPYHYNEESPF